MRNYETWRTWDPDDGDDDEPTVEENCFLTLGSVCHWCMLRTPAWEWGPYGTRVCDHCQRMIQDGRAVDVIEELAARLTVRGHLVDPEKWRELPHAQMTRWLEVRTDCHSIADDSEDDL